MKIDISEVNKGDLLAELYNGSQVRGMGVFQAHRGPETMTYEQGREIIEATKNLEFGDDHAVMFKTTMGRPRLYFDYLFGRVLKVDLTFDEVDPWGYDRDNGEGKFQAIVDKLKSK